MIGPPATPVSYSVVHYPIYTTCGVAVKSGPEFYWRTADSPGRIPAMEKIGFGGGPDGASGRVAPEPKPARLRRVSTHFRDATVIPLRGQEMARGKRGKASASLSETGAPGRRPKKHTKQQSDAMRRKAGSKIIDSSESGGSFAIIGGVRLPKKDRNAAEGSVAESQYPLNTSSSTSADWTRLAADLALCLDDLQEDEFLVLSSKRANHYVQFAAQGRFGMRVEAASNAYIEESEAQLSVEDYTTMARLGWHGPTEPRLDELKGPPDPDGSPNFFLDSSYPVDFQHLAKLVVDTFRQIYRITHPGKLRYKAFARGGTAIRFPTLRLQLDNT